MVLHAIDQAGDLRRRKELLAKAVQEQRKRAERRHFEGDLSAFVRASWPAIDSASYQDSWALDALCDHLTAVTRGHISRLLINFPPRCGKSNIASICWPAWTWAQEQRSFLSGAQVRFLCGSYNHTLSLQHSNKTRRLLGSPFYQQHWGERFGLMGDQNAKHQYDNTRGGSRIATSVGGTLIGLGGDVILVDDPHNTEEVESEADRATVLRWWKEISSTRLNDPKQSAIVVVMQRLHEEDVTGAILKEPGDDWTHLMLPMKHDPARHCVTVLKRDENGEPEQVWEDPREEDKELMWPERYGPKEVTALETKLGPYLASGRLQQSPEPASGGILKRDWWGAYELPIGGKPRHPFQFVIASLDPAFTAKQENDPSGFTVWATYLDRHGDVKILLLHAWKKWLELHGQMVDQLPNEPNKAYVRRASPQWGLVEWVGYECKRLKVHTLLVENKASGHSVAQEIVRLYHDKAWTTRLIDPGAQDKRARAFSIQHLFSSGMVEAPASADGDMLVYREWAQMVIDECAKFRGLAGEEDNLVDSATQALRFLRDSGLAIRREERETAEEMRARHKPQQDSVAQDYFS
jgi:hypothetical protein